MSMSSKHKLKVLFLCTGNSCRSQMAEGFARKLGSDSLDAVSAGINPVGINPRARLVMEEIGISLANHSSKSLETIDVNQINLVVTLCGDAAKSCPAFPRPVKRIHWALEDPAKARGTEEEIMNVFRETRNIIQRHVEELTKGIKT